MICRFILFSVLFLSLCLPVLGIDLIQHGPGVTGTLSPVVTESQFELISEDVEIVLQEGHAEIIATFIIKNPLNVQHKEPVGLPSISVNQDGFDIGKAHFDRNSTLTMVPSERPLEEKIDFDDTVPLMDQFDVMRVWWGNVLLIPAQNEITMTLSYTVPYLYRRETLHDHTEESSRLFMYARHTVAHWKNKNARSVVTVKPRVGQPLHLSFDPVTRMNVDNAFVYESKGPVIKDITVKYDPLHFSVNNGVASERLPKTKPENEFETFGFPNLFDGREETAWCEAEDHAALKKGFEIEWGKNRKVQELIIHPGKGQDGKGFEAHNRLKKILVYFGKPGWQSRALIFEFPDKDRAQSFPIPVQEDASFMGLQIVEVYYGKTENTTCIGEVRIELQ